MCSGKIGRDHPVQVRLKCRVWGTSWLYAPIKHPSDELASHLPLVSSSTCAQSLGNKGGTWSIESAAIKRQCAKSVSASWQRMVMIASLTVPRHRVHCHQTDVPNKACWMKFENTSKSYTLSDLYTYVHALSVWIGVTISFVAFSLASLHLTDYWLVPIQVACWQL